MIVILMGPMGCGKTTIGKLLSRRLGWPFEDGDDFHPPENIAKMKAGVPLGDADRFPWLDILYSMFTAINEQGGNLVLACSALKKEYRRRLGIDQKDILSVYLQGTAAVLQSRIEKRSHHYMNKGLLESQLAALEEPENGVIVSIDASPEVIVEEIRNTIFSQEKKRTNNEA